jgi:hypothetical protein
MYINMEVTSNLGSPRSQASRTDLTFGASGAAAPGRTGGKARAGSQNLRFCYELVRGTTRTIQRDGRMSVSVPIQHTVTNIHDCFLDIMLDIF